MKGWPQKGQALSLGALTPVRLVADGLLEPATEDSVADVGVEAWSAIVCALCRALLGVKNAAASRSQALRG